MRRWEPCAMVRVLFCRAPKIVSLFFSRKVSRDVCEVKALSLIWSVSLAISNWEALIFWMSKLAPSELASFKVAVLGMLRMSPAASEKVLAPSLTRRLLETILDNEMLALLAMWSLVMLVSAILSELMASSAIWRVLVAWGLTLKWEASRFWMS